MNISDLNSNVQCRSYHSLESSQWCHFVNTNTDCSMDEGFINYIRKAFCDFPPHLLPLIASIYALWLILLFAGLGTIAEQFFCPNLEFIASNLKMSQNIAGMTIVAFGNGAPDIFSAIAAFSNRNPAVADVAVGGLLGAAVLLTTGVIGMVTIVRDFDVAKRPFLRDIIFFLAATYWTFYLVYNGEINLRHSLGFLGLYFFYVIFVVVGRFINQKLRQRDRSIEDSTERTNQIDTGDWNDITVNYTHGADTTYEEIKDSSDEPRSVFSQLISGLNPIDFEDWKNSNIVFRIVIILQIPWVLLSKLTVPTVLLNEPRYGWNRPVTSLSLLIAPLFCSFATKSFDITFNGVFPLWALMLLIGACLSLITWLRSDSTNPPKFLPVFAYIGFVVSVIWIYTLANEMVNLIQTLGVFLNVTNVIMGLTFLAWGNSIGDAVSDLTLAKQGYPRMSFSACFGGPLFSIL